MTLTNVQKADEGDYYCVVSNGAGSDASASASLWTERLMAHWTFDNTLVDEVDGWVGVYTDPNAANPTPTAVYDSNSVSGSGQSIVIAGDGLHVQVPGTEDFFNFYTLGFTAAAWVNSNVTDTWGVVLSKQETDISAGWGMAYAYEWQASVIRGATGDLWGWISDAPTSNWNLIVFQYDPDAGEAVVYCNGLRRGGAAVSSAIAPSSVPFIMGTEVVDASRDAHFGGLLDEVKIWSYAIDPYEIAEAYTDVTGETICVNPDDLVYDFSDNCVIDLADFAIFAATWMDCNIVPDCLGQHPY